VNGPTGTFLAGTIQSNSTTAADFSSTSTINGIIFAATAGVNTPDGYAQISGVFTATANGTIQFRATNEGSGAITIRALSSGVFENFNRIDLTCTDNGMVQTDAYSQALATPDLTLALSDNLNSWADYFTYGLRPRWRDSLAKTVNDVDSGALTKTAADDLNAWQDGYAQI